MLQVMFDQISPSSLTYLWSAAHTFTIYAFVCNHLHYYNSLLPGIADKYLTKLHSACSELSGLCCDKVTTIYSQCSTVVFPSHWLRSHKGITLSVPRVKTNAGTRPFHSCNPSLWNNLPLSVCLASSTATFRKCLENISLTWPFLYKHHYVQWPHWHRGLVRELCHWTRIQPPHHWV